ncbi:tyrosine-type recombinase/integrase [Micromonospora sp. NPDC050795]|uniref:tyrosine-type recombinase/integrase n=1 Tax=Micromonospora sp. NPDC050795 TaxID=3364282 RepID=UPI003791D6F4
MTSGRGRALSRSLRARAIKISLPSDGYVFSPDPEGGTPLVPDTATQRFSRMAARLGVTTNLHALRHYSATELIAAGVDVRTVAGRLRTWSWQTTHERAFR